MTTQDVEVIFSSDNASEEEQPTSSPTNVSSPSQRNVKTWGAAKFWGVGFDFDPVWMYTEDEVVIIKELMEICRVHIRPKASKVDRDYVFPRASMEVLAKKGYLNLVVPRELGGHGASNTTVMLVCETLARYGDPSVAMVYIMHLSATFFLCAAHLGNPEVQTLLGRLKNECLIGTVAASDPTTGGHFWYFLSAKSQRLHDGRIRLHKFVSWVTSAGHADFYVVGAPDPDIPRTADDTKQASHTAFFLLYRNEVRANSDSYRGLGLHGNHSGPAICEAVLSPDRLLTGKRMRTAEGVQGGDDYTSVYQCLQCSAFLGMALGAVDLAKSHVVNKIHADTGQKISDYPIIQDYFGTSLSRINVARFSMVTLMKRIDEETKYNDWSLTADPTFRPRAPYAPWSLQLKVVVSQLADDVCTKMVRACGGAGYTVGLGIERLLRDSKAFWLMGPSTEMARKIVGQMILNGCGSVDLYDTACDMSALYHHLNKLTAQEKRAVAMKILDEADRIDGRGPKPFQDQGEDFDNPFNTAPTTFNDMTELDGAGQPHGPGLHPLKWTPLTLVKKTVIDRHTFLFSFALPQTSDHTGTLPGQHVQVRIVDTGGKREHSRRYYSPISKPYDYGRIELIVRYECQGVLAQHMRKMVEGDRSLEFRGPSGGFEYYPDSLNYLIAICGGNGVTPAIQLARCIQDNPDDKCRMYLFYANAKPSQILLRDELTERAKRRDEQFSVKFVVGDASDVKPDGYVLEGFMDEKFLRLHKFASWLTSAGQADFYVVGAPDPDFHPKNHKEAVEEPKKNALFLLFKNEIRASPESYRAMGLHGNLSGPAFCDAVLNEDRMLTRTLAKAKVTDGLPPGDDFTPLIQLFQCAAHVGLAFGAMDLAKMHASSRVHADTGKMLAEYSLIQEYVGNCLTRANVARFALYCVTQRLDEVTSRNDWSKHQDPMYRPRRPYQLWAHQVKICVAQMSDEVCSDMLRACGGSGYLTSMGLERLLRDTKALWLMAPSVELARRFVGHVALLGKDSLDMFHTKCDYAGLYRELGKMSSSEKRAVAARLLTDADLLDGRGPPRFPGQEKDFENPFNTGPSTYNDIVLTSRDGTQHNPGLHPIRWTRLRLAEKVPLDASTVKLVFAFPNSLDHSGCLPGQYIQVRIWKNESEGETADSRRYYSPVSKPDDYGKLEMVVRLYQDGVMAAHMERLQVGDESLEFRGPCGGFEYYPNSLDYVVVIVAGVGATPGIQLARCIQDDRQDRCKCVLIYANSSATDIIFFGELVERASHSAGRLSVTFVVTDHSNAMPHQLVKEAFVDEEFLKKYLPEDLLSRRFKIVVCGGAGFVVSVLYSLRAMFVPPECLFVYGATGTRYVKAVYGRSAFLSSHKSTEVPYAWQPTSTAMAAAMVSMKSDQCAARLIVGPDGKKRILLGNRDVCRGIRLEGWAKKPNVAHERGGNFYISPDD